MSWLVGSINVSSGAPTYTAQQWRQLDSALLIPHPTGSSRPLGTTSGRRPGSFLVTLSGSTVNIGPGAGWLDVQSPAATGPYPFASDAVDTSLTVPAAHATLTRIDLVAVTLNDTDVDSSTIHGTVVPTYITGTAGSGAPSLGARQFLLATITVPHSGAGSPSVVMSTVHAIAAGGILPVPAGTYPASSYKGQVVADPNNGLMISNATAFAPVTTRLVTDDATPLAGSAWDGITQKVQLKQRFTGTIAGGSGAFPLTFSTAFPNGLLYCSITLAENNVVLTASPVAGSYTLSGVSVQCVTAFGTPKANGSTPVVFYDAIGW